MEEKKTDNLTHLPTLSESNRERFSSKALEYGTKSPNMGPMAEPDGYAKVTGPCGDTVEMFLRINKGRIEEARYTTDGCVSSRAACSAATLLVKGKTVPSGQLINPDEILDHLNGLPEESVHCAKLASITLQEAVKNLKEKNS